MLGLFLLLFFSSPVLSQDDGSEEKYLYYLYDHSGKMVKEGFYRIIHRFETLWASVAEEHGKKLVIVGEWNSYSPQAEVFLEGEEKDIWLVKLTGGLGIRRLMTADAVAGVICHELGHFLGGVPKKIPPENSAWSSVEGGADYFATAVCLRRYFRQDNNREIMAQVSVPPLVQEKCRNNFPGPEEAAICERTAMASFSMASFDAHRKGLVVSFYTPDLTIVSSTLIRTNAPQCRLDTYFQGALCPKSRDNTTIHDADTSTWACTREEGYVDGVRPLCWFNPLRGPEITREKYWEFDPADSQQKTPDK